MGIFNAIGNFILMEVNHLMGAKRSAPQVLVDLDTSGGLPMELQVVWEVCYFVQKI